MAFFHNQNLIYKYFFLGLFGDDHLFDGAVHACACVPGQLYCTGYTVMVTKRKENEIKLTKSNLKAANTNLKSFADVVREIKKTAPPKVKRQLITLEKQAKQVQVDIKRGIKEFNRVEKEKIEQKNLYLSLMSLQDYAAEIAHVVRTSLSKVLRHAEFLKKHFPDPKYDDLYKKYFDRI